MKLPTDRVFGLSFSVVFLVIATIGFVVFDRRVVWALAVSATFALLAVLKPGVLMPLNRIWGKVVPKIAFVTNGIVLGLAFLLVVLPFGLVMRALGRDPMRRKIDESASTYWIPARHRDSRDSYKDLF